MYYCYLGLFVDSLIFLLFSIVIVTASDCLENVELVIRLYSGLEALWCNG